MGVLLRLHYWSSANLAQPFRASKSIPFTTRSQVCPFLDFESGGGDLEQL